MDYPPKTGSFNREHIDLERRTIFIPKAKAGAREQPITAHLAEYVKVLQPATRT